MATPLIVIDMQPYFHETAKVALKETLHQIKLAMRRNDPILIVEYTGCGESYPEINKLVKGYDKVAYVKKWRDGGGAEVYEAAHKNGFKLKKARVVGVNRSYCVYSTVKGMMANFGKIVIEVVKSATWCSSPENGLEWLKEAGCRLK